jgi:hypothetical protein
VQNKLYEQTLWALPTKSHKAMPTFLTALSSACQSSPPPYGEQWYATAYDRCAGNPDWLAASFFTYASEERDGARRLAVLADQIGPLLPKALPVVWKHARDEARHVLYFLELLDHVFPKAPQDLAARELLEHNNPLERVSSKRGSAAASRVVSEVIRINIGEVKNRVHLSMMRGWAMTYCPRSQASRVDEITSRLIQDEINHITYTGMVLEMLHTLGLAADLAEHYSSEFHAFNDQLLGELTWHNINPTLQKTTEMPHSRGTRCT